MTAAHQPNRGEQIECARRMLEHGVPDGMTISEALVVCERLILHATMEREPRIARAARLLGISREGLYKRRRRCGLDIDAGGQKPIPSDWRERLGA